MNWTQYCKAAALTESIPVIDLGPRVTRLLHACIGFSGEYFEYKEATTTQNKLEELGDMPWYLAIIFNELELTVDPIDPAYINLPNPDHGVPVEHWLGMFNDIMHRAIFYNTALDKPTKHYPQSMEAALVEVFVNLYHYVHNECHLLGYSIFKILEMNIEKLAKRYPNLAFDKDASNNKVEEVELSHIPETPPVPITPEMLFYMQVVVLYPSEPDQVNIVATLALACANNFSRLGASTLSAGCRTSYVKILEIANWEGVKSDGWQLYLMRYGQPNSSQVIADNLQELKANEKCL